MSGGGTGHGPGDVYYDGWHITALRLREHRLDSEWEISFYQTGSFTAMIPVGEIVIDDEVECDAHGRPGEPGQRECHDGQAIVRRKLQ